MLKGLRMLALLAATLVVVARADAAEQQLAGVRLGQQAMELFNQKPYGPPDFFGPDGAVVTWEVLGTPARSPGAAPAANSGSLSLGLSSSAGFTLGAPPAAAPVQGTVMYWLYHQPFDVDILLGLDPGGRITTITIYGKSYPGAVTENGVRLGDTFTSVLDKYGFPDSTSGGGGNLTLVYSNAGLTLTLTQMQVTTIALGQAPPPAAPSIAAPTPAGPMPTIGAPTAGGPSRRRRVEQEEEEER